jgi:hypothetical protein
MCRLSLAARSSSAGAGGAPPTNTRAGSSSGSRSSALTMVVSTVGAAHRWVTACCSIRSHTRGGSTRRRFTLVAPAATTPHVRLQPLQWNIGSTHRYTLSGPMRSSKATLSAFKYAPRCV